MWYVYITSIVASGLQSNSTISQTLSSPEDHPGCVLGTQSSLLGHCLVLSAVLDWRGGCYKTSSQDRLDTNGRRSELQGLR